MWQRDCRPTALLPREGHVRSLDLPTRMPFLDVEIQTNERKGQRDWLGLLIRVLSRKRIHEVLMNERQIAVR
jgi:hypothetical protein